jgi:hypothetical protein
MIYRIVALLFPLTVLYQGEEFYLKLLPQRSFFMHHLLINFYSFRKGIKNRFLLK